MDPSVVVTERFSLQCESDSSLRGLAETVRLGPLDQLSRWFLPVAVVFIYRRPEVAGDEIVPVDRLQRTLRRLLDYYPHLTGRVVANPEDQALQIERLGEGAELLSAHCDAPLAAFEAVGEDDEPGALPRLLGTKFPAGGSALLPPFDRSEEAMANEPILRLQHTRFSCGGVALGLRIRHIICDAEGFFQLVRDLAELYRGFRSIDLGQTESDCVSLAQPPLTRSYLADLSPEESKDALKFRPNLFKLAPEVQPTSAASSPSGPVVPPAPVLGRLLRFSESELASIKAEANIGNAGQMISTFEALTAHLWQCVHRARICLCEKQGMTLSEAMTRVPLQLLPAINMRGIGRLEMPPRYFPNCVLCPFFSLAADQLLNAPLSSVAASVHQQLRSIDAVKFRQTLRWIAAQPNKLRVQTSSRYEEGDFIVTAWNKFGMYRGVEFDVPPALVYTPFTPISLVDGVAYFLGTEDQLRQQESGSGDSSGAIDVAMALSETLWDTLDNDERFRLHRKK